MDHEEFLRRVKSNIKTPTQDMEHQLEEFTKLCTYISGQYDDDESFVELRKHLEELEGDRKTDNRIFYMALPPSVFTTVSQHLKKCCFPKSGIARIVVRKSSTANAAVVKARSDLLRRWRSHSVRISRAHEPFKKLWSQTGRKRSSIESITTLAKRW